MPEAAIAEKEETEDVDLSFITEDEDIFEREFSADERERLAKAGKAMSGGGFPIQSRLDLMNAMHAIGRASDPAAAKAHIRKRAKAMGMSAALGDAFKEDEETVLAGVTEAVEIGEEAEGIVDVTIIKAGWSENGRYYSPDVLRQSIKLFEGTSAFIDHPSRTEQRERPNRSVSDLAGIFENVHQAPNGDLKAKLRLIGKAKEELLPWVQEAIAGKADIGISLRAGGRTREGIADGRKGTIVEGLTVVHSADIVTKPAAGGRFERLVASDWLADLLKDVSFDDWRNYHPEHKEVQMTDINEQVASVVQEAIKPLAEQLEASKRRESARAKLEASPLPKVLFSDLLEQAALLAEDEQDAFVEWQVGMIKKLNLRPIITGAGQGSSADETTVTEAFGTKVLGIRGAFVKPGESVWEYRDRIRGQTA